MTGLVLRRAADVQIRDSGPELQLLDGHVGAYKGVVGEYEQIGVGEEKEEGLLEIANNGGGEVRVGVAGCADLVPDELGVGTVRVGCVVCLRLDFSGGVADFGDAVDGVLEGLRILSRRIAPEGRRIHLGVQ